MLTCVVGARRMGGVFFGGGVSLSRRWGRDLSGVTPSRGVAACGGTGKPRSCCCYIPRLRALLLGANGAAGRRHCRRFRGVGRGPCTMDAVVRLWEPRVVDDVDGLGSRFIGLSRSIEATSYSSAVDTSSLASRPFPGDWAASPRLAAHGRWSYRNSLPFAAGAWPERFRNLPGYFQRRCSGASRSKPSPTPTCACLLDESAIVAPNLYRRYHKSGIRRWCVLRVVPGRFLWFCVGIAHRDRRVCYTGCGLCRGQLLGTVLHDRGERAP